jgi:glutaredoxin-like protein NrdH
MSITVYTKPSCVQCEQTKKYLDRNGLEYTSIDITEDKEAFDMVAGLGFQSAPVVITDKGNWAGFRPDYLAKLAA